MISSTHSFSLFLLSLFITAISCTPGPLQHQLWKTPNGSVANDFSQQFSNGNNITLEWNNIDPHKFSVNTTKLDLWVASFDWDTTKARYSHRLMGKSRPSTKPIGSSTNPVFTENVDVTKHGGSFKWKVAIPNNILATDGEYVITFKPAGSSYNYKANGLPSPGFTILNNQTPSNHTKSPTSTPTPTPTPPPSNSPSLSSAAIAGMSIGIGAAVFALLGTAASLFFRRKGKMERDAEELRQLVEGQEDTS
ncbi:hypothetical protein NA57DRAFT_51783 [Rhizodiscina lignyota]|uniref:Ser-Thr-rich glycosyl-phosphatidyl-inositol-anchored membrane family-domain-containing protein n=1 Tax=Rhizodiscina lignyota TaxID=1504668 RepID=A0A9P4MF10_9PEZI|nr:hypothetical protein NA57DRAFT_51783 [Rhizodiscina lignyota]